MNAATEKVIESFGTDPSNRHLAATLREHIVQTLESRVPPFTIDFQGVRTISDSFADELFAVLIAERGEEWFKTHVAVVNLADDLRQTVLQVIHNRLEREGGLPV